MSIQERYRSATAAPTAEERRLEVVPCKAGHFVTRHHQIQGRCIDESLLMLVGAGAGSFSVGGRRSQPLAAGDAVLLPAHQPHDFACDPVAGWDLQWVHFQGSWADALARQAGFSGERLVVHLGHETEPSRRLATLLDLLESRAPHSQLDAAVELVALLVAIKKCDIARLGEDARLIALVERGGLAEMAAAAGLSRFHFLRRFKRATGTTPWRYLTELRLAKAKSLLTEPATGVRAAATAAGFSDPAYFARLFRRRTGLTPSAYRAMHCPLPG